MLVLLGIAILLGLWFSVIDLDEMTIEQFHLFANYLDQLVFEYVVGYLFSVGLLYSLGIILQIKRMYVLNQVSHFVYWFFPLLLILNKVSSVYQYSLFLPAYNLPYYILLMGLIWVAWQASKFMSGMEYAIAFKYR